MTHIHRVPCLCHAWSHSCSTMPSGNPDSAIPYTLEKVKAEAAASEWMTIVGFGSLLSEKSARVTCPNLKDFKLARIQGYRRVFTHPAALFFERGIAVPGTLEISSLSTEPHEGAGFVAATFDAPAAEVPALMEREEEFDFVKVRPGCLQRCRDVPLLAPRCPVPPCSGPLISCTCATEKLNLDADVAWHPNAG